MCWRSTRLEFPTTPHSPLHSANSWNSTKMPPHRPASLWQAAAAARGPGDQYIAENDLKLRIADLTSRSMLGEQVEELHGRSVLVSTKDQISTAVVLLELDGIVGRVVLIPPDAGLTDYSYLYGSAQADVIV